ncbi:CvpA family protein [Palleronia caenipelagi]|uniref:CvpA family protein n=1 Tax=Palleronia caenipelagi TaxID=2489174 RepID=A0A547Q309_9RHOB|nr:CvpA family protein [Palleronia caenipelagi]TRD20769.1 CvpA family protein [Palleronia caenipelagi]
MDGYTIVDGIVVLLLVVSALLAYSRGFVREATSIAGWIVAGIGAFAFAPMAQPLVREIPYLDKYLSSSCELSIIFAFGAVFLAFLIVFWVFTPILSGLIQDSALGPVDRTLGFVFGVLRGLVLIAVAFFVYEKVAVTEGVAQVDQSRSANIYAKSQNAIEDTMPEDAPGWIVQRYEGLVSFCDL